MRQRPYPVKTALSLAALVLIALTATACVRSGPIQLRATSQPISSPTPAPTEASTAKATGRPLPKVTLDDLCDALSIKKIDSITGMDVRPPTAGSSTHCTWWNGSGYGKGGTTLTIKPGGYVNQIAGTALSSGLYKPVSGIGIRAIANDRTLPPPIGQHVILVVDYGSFDITLSVTCAGITTAKAFTLAKSAEQNY